VSVKDNTVNVHPELPFKLSLKGSTLSPFDPNDWPLAPVDMANTKPVTTIANNILMDIAFL